ncbi:uncharacterized protein [Epargyreus clarus]|uniref:uncharacterized protein n=1 Tax=Epargyreus clarus TaxID=520877 RepID=UPI003C2DCB25
MFVVIVVFCVMFKAAAQDQALSTASPQASPFLDLFTGASNYYGDSIRKAYDPGYYGCPKSDTLSSFASMLASAAKIMFSAAVIMFLKLLAGKLLLVPLAVAVLAKLGLKTLFLWPVISKMIKYFKRKKRKGHKSRMITDCSQRLACVIQRSSKSDWSSSFGAAVTFLLVDDVDEDSTIAKSLLSVLAGDKVAQCMSIDCGSGVDIS